MALLTTEERQVGQNEKDCPPRVDEGRRQGTEVAFQSADSGCQDFQDYKAFRGCPKAEGVEPRNRIGASTLVVKQLRMRGYYMRSDRGPPAAFIFECNQGHPMFSIAAMRENRWARSAAATWRAIAMTPPHRIKECRALPSLPQSVVWRLSCYWTLG